MDVIVATGNQHKLAELRTLLGDVPVRLLGLGDLAAGQRFTPAEETGSTFSENADLKAVHAAQSTGLYALADDSGLEIPSLDGRPGVYSARFAGEGAGDIANNRKLIAEARAAGLVRPAAIFRCVLSVATPDGLILARGEGCCEGVLIEEPRGRGGFGYDPHFLVPSLDRTFAELLPSEKNAISHRALAIADLKRAIAPLVG